MNTTTRGTALVTGASTGIGLATAQALRQAGFKVFGTSRRTLAENANGITMLTCDVTDDASVAKLVENVLARAGSIDLVVNNAGIGLIAGAEESSIAQAQSLFDVNVFGALRVTNAVLPTMRRQGKGRIINMSSVLGLIPAPYSALYSATKHAIEGYSESLDHEVREFGIRIVLVEPAYTKTAFEENLTTPDRPLAVYECTLRRPPSPANRRRPRRCCRNRREGCDRQGAQAAIYVGSGGSPSPVSPPICPRNRLRQEPPKADAIAVVRPSFR
jgi:NAD(P)-dependent dehydrogenase (short-subunit alcohol dehydrogenase family)